jgi:hypothetical protein
LWAEQKAAAGLEGEVLGGAIPRYQWTSDWLAALFVGKCRRFVSKFGFSFVGRINRGKIDLIMSLLGAI